MINKQLSFGTNTPFNNAVKLPPSRYISSLLYTLEQNPKILFDLTVKNRNENQSII